MTIRLPKADCYRYPNKGFGPKEYRKTYLSLRAGKNGYERLRKKLVIKLVKQ